jgi:uncharacterized LabA/DUF88 family protein
MKSFRKFALLADVDGSGITSEELKKITDKVEALGDICYTKLYGINDKKNREFAEFINGKCCDTAGILRTKKGRKTQLDSRIIVDAMKIAASGAVDSFAIIGGEGDYGYLLSALKAMGMYIAGRFDSDLNIAFCDIYLVDFEQTAEETLTTDNEGSN